MHVLFKNRSHRVCTELCSSHLRCIGYLTVAVGISVVMLVVRIALH